MTCILLRLKWWQRIISICCRTDALARGIDIGEIDHVVSYDCPQFVKTYIHRVGRTARAGRPGTGVTLVEKSEAKRFKQLLREAGKTGVADETVDEDQLDLKAYDAAKQQVAAVIKAERESKKKATNKKGRVKKIKKWQSA